jgi:hypothetical protein
MTRTENRTAREACICFLTMSIGKMIGRCEKNAVSDAAAFLSVADVIVHVVLENDRCSDR